MKSTQGEKKLHLVTAALNLLQIPKSKKSIAMLGPI